MPPKNYFQESFNRNYQNYKAEQQANRQYAETFFPELKEINELKDQGYTFHVNRKVVPVGSGRTQAFNDVTATSPEGETIKLADAHEAAINWAQANPVSDPSENILNDMMVFGTGLEPLFKSFGTKLFNAGIRRYGSNRLKSFILNNEMRPLSYGRFNTQSEIIPVTRYRLGDVEINDPNLNYRQGASGMVNDFQKSGQVRVKYEGDAAAKREKTSERILLTKSFNNPMFKQGGLWYDGWLVNEPGEIPKYPDLLVTRQPLRFANKSSRPIKADSGGRRIPFSSEQLNPQNTSAYIWEDGYGFRKQRFGDIPIFSLFKKGGSIHIKEKNKGKFTEYCGGKVTNECIQRAKNSGNTKLVKRATFAQNARKFKH